MSHDEVVRADGVGGWGLIIVGAVIAALFSLATNSGQASQPSPNLAPLPTAAATAAPAAPPSLSPSSAAPPASPSAAPVPSLDPTQATLELHEGFVSAHELCPVNTDHHSALAITLVMGNDTPVTEKVVGLSAALPLQGLVDQGVLIRSGTCATPFGKPVRAAGQVLPSGTTMLITLHLGLPKTCPKPYPVDLDVTLSIDGNIRAERLTLFEDLGTVSFTTCP